MSKQVPSHKANLFSKHLINIKLYYANFLGSYFLNYV